MKTLPKVDSSVLYEIEIVSAPEEAREFLLAQDRKRFEAMVDECPSIGFEVDGRCIGGAFIRYDRLHISVHPDYHSRWRRFYPALVDWTFSVCDPVYGVVHQDNTAGRRFAARSGGALMGTIQLEMGLFYVYKIASGPTRQRRLYRPTDVQRHAEILPDEVAA